MGRVEEYLGDRLRGRAIPDDLRRLVEAELDGAFTGPDWVQPFAEVHVLGPGERHSLQDVEPLPDDDDDDVRANGRAIDEVLSHVAVVVDGFNGDLFGYWMHPDEPGSDHLAIVKLDTEGQFDTLPGSTLVEAMVFDWLGYDDDEEYLARIVAFCERHGIPLAARTHADLHEPQLTVNPGQLHDHLYRRYQPYTRRPAWADAEAAVDGPALVGLPVTDPRLRSLLERLGFPDAAATAAAIDDGMGEVRLASPVANIQLVLYVDEDGSWWLHTIRYRRPTSDRPLELPLPYGFSLDDDRSTMSARFGPPQLRAIAPVDRWHIGHVVAFVPFDGEDRPRFIEFWPLDVPRRS